MLACTVRGCGEPLARNPHVFICPNGHSFDIARSGYVNLLQPQDRRSLTAGDTKDAVAARARLTAAGVGRGLVEALVERVAGVSLEAEAPVVDLGCGTGSLLTAVVERTAAAGIGIDLSVPAIEHAARTYDGATWVVANADRTLPFVSGSVGLMLSQHARRNPQECARALMPGGRLIVAVPAEDDLIELRESVMGERVERSRVEALVAEHAAMFRLCEQSVVRQRHHLEGDLLRDLLLITYRGARTRQADAARALTSLEVTLASDVVVFERTSA